MAGSSFGRLDSFGIGAPSALSKLKSEPAAIPAATLKQTAKLKTVIHASAKFSRLLATKPRLLLHIGLVVLAATTVFAGNSSRPAASVMSRLQLSQGEGAYLDKAAEANVAAAIAVQANLAVASQAASAATTLNAQVNLPTSGDGFLAKNAAVTTAGKVNRGVTNYQIQKGDTITSIASKFNVTSDTIKWANNLTDSSTLTPGQKLTVLPISGLIYTVQGGDTPEALAARYQSNADQIISFNNLEVKGLVPGQKIVIPDGVVPAPKPKPMLASVAPGFVPLFGYNGYAVGQCTWYVASRRSVPANWGNAISWYYSAKNTPGFSTGSVPSVGAIAWEIPGAGVSRAGHVAYVESVAGGQVLVSEMNYNGNAGRVTYRWASAGEFFYIY